MGLFRLALLLGKSVRELDITWREFQYWNAYLKLEPPEAGANQRAAAVMAQITNMAGRSLKDRRTVTAADFLGEHEPDRQPIEDQIAFFKSLGKDHG